MTDIDMDDLVPNPFPTIQTSDDARALMAQLNKALTTAETALYNADTLVAALNDTDYFRDQWLPWNQGRNMRMRVEQAIDAVVTAQAMHAPYPTTVSKPVSGTVWYFANGEEESSDEVYSNLIVAQNAAVQDFATDDPEDKDFDPSALYWRHHIYANSDRDVWLLDYKGTFTGWSVNQISVAAVVKAAAR